MGVHYLTAGAGSPGVTTTALGITMMGRAPALLVDASCDGSQAVVAGFLHGASASGCGLESFARSHRMGSDFRMEAATLALDQAERRLLPGFSHLGAVELFSPMWGAFAAMLREVADQGVRVIVDGGRFMSLSRSDALVRIADRVSLVARTSLRQLAATSAVHQALGEAVSASSRAVEHDIILVGENQPYTSREVEEQFEWPVCQVLPWLPDHAQVLSDGADPPRRWSRSPLLMSLRSLTESGTPAQEVRV